MQRLFHDQPIPEELRGAIIALGNFDGFHLGHQAVVGRAVQRGAHDGAPASSPPSTLTRCATSRPDTPPFRLTTLDQRQRMFDHAGADAMLVFKFGSELASTTAEDFVSKLLAEQFGAAGVVTGEDFTFGKGRGGNVNALRELGRATASSPRRSARCCSTGTASPRAGSARLSRPAIRAQRSICFPAPSRSRRK